MMKRFLTLLALISSTYLIAQIPTAGLVAYYPFNGNANDESSNGHDGVVNGATVISDRFGNADKAYSFNGSSNFIEVPHAEDLNFTTEMSISAWIKPESGGENNYGRIISKFDGTSKAWDFMLDLSTPNTLLATRMNGTTMRSNSVNIFDGVWHNVVLTYQLGVGAKFYIDNEMVGESALQTGTLNNNTSEVKIGMWSKDNNRYFDGAIDDIRLYNAILTSNEITAIYEEPNPNGGGGPSLWTANGPKIYYNSGNVGIGTTNPLSLLSVDGLIRAEEIKVVTDVDVPDYVFEPDYPLRSLDDLRSYIRDEGHLPDIPSAAEIRLANGFELGDMDMRLLRKIEELTLYTLEQEKLLDQYKKKIENQEIRLLNQKSMISEILKRIEKLEIKP